MCVEKCAKKTLEVGEGVHRWSLQENFQADVRQKLRKENFGWEDNWWIDWIKQCSHYSLNTLRLNLLNGSYRRIVESSRFSHHWQTFMKFRKYISWNPDYGFLHFDRQTISDRTREHANMQNSCLVSIPWWWFHYGFFVLFSHHKPINWTVQEALFSLTCRRR